MKNIYNCVGDCSNNPLHWNCWRRHLLSVSESFWFPVSVRLLCWMCWEDLGFQYYRFIIEKTFVNCLHIAREVGYNFVIHAVCCDCVGRLSFCVCVVYADWEEEEAPLDESELLTDVMYTNSQWWLTKNFLIITMLRNFFRWRCSQLWRKRRKEAVCM